MEKLIKQRLKEFSKPRTEKQLFQELCFCILTANTSAKMGIDTINYLGNAIHNNSEQQLAIKLKDAKYRFYNKRANYIATTRNNLKPYKLKQVIKELKGNDLREFFIKNVKGFGYKESSHFLRNIGFQNYAILDKHILNTMVDKGILSERKPLNKNSYLELEKKFNKIAKKEKVSPAELDLIWWSNKTGEVLK
jgi:N-glycosylase/DNA lyase